VIRYKFSVCLAAIVVFAGCQNAANTSTNGNSSTTIATAANSNTNSASTGNGATANDPGDFNGSPTEVYKAAYTARQNCDLAGLKKVMSKQLLDRIDQFAKEDKKSLDDEIKDICKEPQASTQQVRNEKIDGDHASIEYLDEKNNWQRMDFIREGGVWKMSMGSPGEDEPDNSINDKDDNRS